MEKIKIRFIRTINWVTKHRNKLFLIACLAIHAVYAGLFHWAGIWFLTALNLFSCCFYFFFLVIRRDTSERSMLAAYFEILFFSVMSELALGPDYGFYLYIIGMSASVFYLLPSYVNKRFLYQSAGIALVLILEAVMMLTGIHFDGIRSAAGPYQPAVFLGNIGITATIVLAAAFLYSKEIEAVWGSLNYNMHHDALTDLYNRRFLEDEIRHLPEEKRTEFVICMMDIDFFKKVNDTYGHEAGDVVLTRVASCLKDTAGEDNMAVRWGGEEFILYFPGMKKDQAYRITEQLRRRIEDMVIETDGKKIRVTVTGGIAAGLPGSNYEKVIKRADEKLYMGKQQGRNRVIL